MKRVGKLSRWLVCLVLCLCVAGAVSYYAPANEVQAQLLSGTKLNKQQYTMFVGDTYGLTLQKYFGDIKWSSTNKKVATVSEDGQITAVGAGKATIKATIQDDYSEVTFKCKVVVKKGNGKGIAISSKNFPDKGFREFVKSILDDDQNGYISNEELLRINVLDVKNDEAIKDIRGAELLPTVEYIYCNDDQTLGLEKVSDDVKISFYSKRVKINQKCKMGDKLTLRVDDSYLVAKKYSVKVIGLEKSGKALRLRLEVSYDGKTIDQTFEVENGKIVNSYSQSTEITPYEVVYCANKNNDAVFKFVKRKYPKPMKLSGKAEDVYKIKDYSYVVGNGVDLFFDKGIEVTGDTLVIVEQVMSELEEKTGLKFRNNSLYSTLPSTSWRESYFGCDPWNGYNYYSKDKLSLYFVHDRDSKGWISFSDRNVIVLIDDDFDFHKESVNTLAHELAHSLDRSNHENFYRVLTEGFGSYWGRQISILHPEFISTAQKEYGPNLESYWSMPTPIDSKNAESLFNAEFDRVGNASYYEYGFQLMTYLYETYPLNKVNNFYKNLSKKLKELRYQDEYGMDMERAGFLGDYSSSAFETEALKEYFGDDFFEKFGAWADKNYSRFCTYM